jgi:hypothetical protein
MFRVAFVIALLLAFPLPAFADRADADACSVKLAGLSLATYQAAIDKAAAGATLRQAIGGYLKPLYDAGKISERQGYKSGYAAAMCVRLVHRKTPTRREQTAEHRRAEKPTGNVSKRFKVRNKDDDDDDDDD